MSGHNPNVEVDQVILGTVIGAVMGKLSFRLCSGMVNLIQSLGLGFSQLMKFSHRKGFIDRESYVAQYLALAIFTIGVVSTIGSDDLLAAFAAGKNDIATLPQTCRP